MNIFSSPPPICVVIEFIIFQKRLDANSVEYGLGEYKERKNYEQEQSEYHPGIGKYLQIKGKNDQHHKHRDHRSESCSDPFFPGEQDHSEGIELRDVKCPKEEWQHYYV